MNRLTITNEILDEINFEVPSDKEGSYNILDIVKYSDEEEMQKILLNIADRLASYEDTGFEPEEIEQLNASDVSKEESSIKYYNEMRKYRDELKYYKDLEKQLIDKYNGLKNKIDGDGAENYTTGYKYGHRNGQIELLEWILKIDTGYREEAEKVLEVEND